MHERKHKNFEKTQKKKMTLVSRQKRENREERKKERKKERKGKSERDNANNTTIDRTVPSSSFACERDFHYSN